MSLFRGLAFHGARLLVPLLAIAMLLTVQRRYRVVMVDGRSMEPTFHDGDLLVVDRLAYRDDPVQRDDVVVGRYRNDLLVKRVVGLPGEIVEVRDGAVLVNGYPVGANPDRAGTMELRPGWVGQNRVALLGDNRSMHPGEHVHAVVPQTNLMGRVAWHLRWR